MSSSLKLPQMRGANKALPISIEDAFDTIGDTVFPLKDKNLDTIESFSIASNPGTPFHVMRSWAPCIEKNYLDTLFTVHKDSQNSSHPTQSVNSQVKSSVPHQQEVTKRRKTGARKRKNGNLHHKKDTSFDKVVKHTSDPSSEGTGNITHLPHISKLTLKENHRIIRSNLHTIDNFSNGNSQNITILDQCNGNDYMNAQDWEKEWCQVKNEVKKLLAEASIDSNHVENHSQNTVIYTTDRKGLPLKELRNRAPNRGILGLSNRLQRRIQLLKSHPAEMYAFNQRIELILQDRHASLKNQPKKSFPIISQNVKDIRNQVLEKRLENHFIKSKRRREKACLQYHQLEEIKYEKVKHLEAKLQKLEQISSIKSPAERLAAFQNIERQRIWLTIVVIGSVFQKLHEAITEDRKSRIHTVTLHSDATTDEKKAFTILKRRLLMEIRNESKDDITSNPFLAAVRYSLHKRQEAARMIRIYLQEQLNSKVIIGTMNHYRFCVIKCQRIARQFLQCKRAREKLLTHQFIKYEEKRITQTKKSMLQDLSSIDTMAVSVPSSLQRQVQQKKLLIQNEEEQFARVPAEIRYSFIHDSLRKRRLDFVRQQIIWERKIKLYQGERKSKDTLILHPTQQTFSTLLPPAEILDLVIQAEAKLTELGRRAQERTKIIVPQLSTQGQRKKSNAI